VAKEIERKFLVETISFLASLTGKSLKQGYLQRQTIAFARGSGTPEPFGSPALLISAFQQDIAVRIPVPEKDVEGLEKLLAGDHVTVRIRLESEKGLLTLKGPTEGLERPEFEYEIAQTIAQNCLNGPYVLPGTIEKTRYEIEYAGHVFEVDVFEGKLAGLVVAEVELASADEYVEIPDWAGTEVSEDPRYFNSNLAIAGVVPVR
jgi:adenylate cyclase